MTELNSIRPTFFPARVEDYGKWWESHTVVPFGFCWCGCGTKTRISPKNNFTVGHFKGQPLRFLATHVNAKYTNSVCHIEECERRPYARGICRRHYQNWLRYRNPTYKKPRIHRTTHGKSGYASVLAPEHPRADARQRVLEHVLVIEGYIGRYLYPHEQVHHLNGVRDDNRLENLELWSTSHPSGQRVRDKLTWALALIDQYGDDPSRW